MRKRIVSCAMAFLMAFTLMPCAAFAGEASAEGQVESLEAENLRRMTHLERADWMRRFSPRMRIL